MAKSIIVQVHIRQDRRVPLLSRDQRQRGEMEEENQCDRHLINRADTQAQFHASLHRAWDSGSGRVFLLQEIYHQQVEWYLGSISKQASRWDHARLQSDPRGDRKGRELDEWDRALFPKVEWVRLGHQLDWREPPPAWVDENEINHALGTLAAAVVAPIHPKLQIISNANIAFD